MLAGVEAKNPPYLRVPHSLRIVVPASYAGGVEGWVSSTFSVGVLVELSGIEPLTSSLRIQDTTSDGETPDDTE